MSDKRFDKIHKFFKQWEIHYVFGGMSELYAVLCPPIASVVL